MVLGLVFVVSVVVVVLVLVLMVLLLLVLVLLPFSLISAFSVEGMFLFIFVLFFLPKFCLACRRRRVGRFWRCRCFFLLF